MSERLTYHVIHVSEDGDVSLEFLTREALERRLNEGYWHNTEPLEQTSDLTSRSGLFIIKGEQVIPKPVSVVEKYEVD